LTDKKTDDPKNSAAGEPAQNSGAPVDSAAQNEEKKPQKIKIENLQTAAIGASSAPAPEVAELKEKLAAAEDRYLRLFAEFDNFRKRTEGERADFARYAAGNFIEAALPVLDSFERYQKLVETPGPETPAPAPAGAQPSGPDGELRKGFALIHKQLEDILQKFGVQKITAVGQPFDPRFHEAVLQKESDQPAHTVLEEMQTGFMLHDRVLRPAMVVVAK
jgi:molecular chaperone GrpE